MGHPVLVSDSDLLRARGDAEFRQQMVHEHLELLLAALNRLRGAANPEQIREGVALAVRLADILHHISESDAK